MFRPLLLSLLFLLATALLPRVLSARTSAAPAAGPAPPAQSSAGSRGGGGRPDRTTEQGEAQITNANQECTPYTFEPLQAVIASYPPLFALASMSHKGVLDSDLAVFAGLNGSIPPIAPEPISKTGDIQGKPAAGDPNCWWTATQCTTPKLAGLEPDIDSCPEPLTWGFTLDDGPNCSHNAYYDFLASVQQKATLFYIGSNVGNWPLEAQRGLADGHEVCAHSWSHPPMTSLTNEEAFAELYYSKKIIHDVLGVTVTCWRPPFGDVDDRIRFLAKALGMTTIIWDNDTEDFDYANIGQAGVEKNYNDILAGASNGTFADEGTVVLSHEIDAVTMSLSQQFLPQIQKAFTGGVMPVGACQNFSQIFGEAGSRYPNYAEYVAGTRTIAVPSPSAASVEVPFASGSIVSSAGFVISASASTIPATLAMESLSSSASVNVSRPTGTGTVRGTGLGAQATAAAVSPAFPSGASNAAGGGWGEVWWSGWVAVVLSVWMGAVAFVL